MTESANGPQTKTQIRAVLDRAGSRPRHRFGQNFMIEPELVRRIVDAGEVATGDHVLEVGPGTGTLTAELLARGATVIAVEIDRDLAAALRETFAEAIDTGRLLVLETDALAGKHQLAPLVVDALDAAGGAKLVANLPYNIASPLVIELLLRGTSVLSFTVQKEVAERFAAGPEAGKSYGPLGVIAQALGKVEVLRTIPPTAFWPQPSIDSSLVRIRHEPHEAVKEPDQARAFARFAGDLFAQRRKALRGKLAAMDLLEAAERVGIDPGARIEAVSPLQLLALFAERGECEARPAAR